MTRPRIYGSDIPFCDWMRNNERLPSNDRDFGFVATDVDLFLHRYKWGVDGIGTREIQAMMFLEVKTRGGDVHDCQVDTLFKIHEMTMTSKLRRIKGGLVRHYGVAFCFLSGITPTDSYSIDWGRFDGSGRIKRTEVDKDKLVDLMRFDLHPDNMTTRPFRRHHKTSQIEVEQTMPLGFTTAVVITSRS